MTTFRFDFQRKCAQDALAYDRGLVLNVGCNDDPARLKELDPKRVVNCDLFDHDQVLDRPNVVDDVFDCARDPWPFPKRSAALVILGDILEHLSPGEIEATLEEARWVGERLCVTVPEDDREETSDGRADEFPRGAVHRTIVTRDLLERLLDAAGWTVTKWETVEYDSGAMWGKRVMGHFVTAE